MTNCVEITAKSAETQEPVAWMFQHQETGNVSFINIKAEAEDFGKRNPRWSVVPLYTKRKEN
jgi:hypothetical protein